MSSVLHYHLPVERTAVLSINLAQSSALKYELLQELHSRNCVSPRCVKSSLFPHLKQSAKLSYILAMEWSVDPLIVELFQPSAQTSFLLFLTLCLLERFQLPISTLQL